MDRKYSSSTNEPSNTAPGSSIASRTELQGTQDEAGRQSTRLQCRSTPASGHIECRVKVGQVRVSKRGVAEKHGRQWAEHGGVRVGTVQKRRHDVQVEG
jgi:hypothetical protein